MSNNVDEKWVWENTRQDFGKWVLASTSNNDPRPETNKLLDMIDDGWLDPKDVVMMCVKYMSEDDVADMIDANELSERFEPEDDYDDDGQPDEAQEWHDFDPDC